MFAKEAMGKCPRSIVRMREFREAVRGSGLMDLGFEGSWFTYSNKRRFPEEARERLVRALVNNAWSRSFNRAVVRHGIAASSDHSHIIIDCAGAGFKRAKRAFRYEAMWQLDSRFQNVLNEAWEEGRRNSDSLVDIQRSCARRLESWNKNAFGNVQSNISKWKRKLETVRSCLRTDGVIQEERRITNKIDNWLEKEELLWKQRAKIDWLKEGDRNTSYFHARASSRRRNNRIVSLCSKTGVLLTEEEEIVAECWGYFVELFQPNVRGPGMDWIDAMKNVKEKVRAEMVEEMNRQFTEGDIKPRYSR